MREVLASWLDDFDVLAHAEMFRLREAPLEYQYLSSRSADIYTALIGEYISLTRDGAAAPEDLHRIAESLGQIASRLGPNARNDALFFAAAAYYEGGYSASAYLTMQLANAHAWSDPAYHACHELITRPRVAASEPVEDILAAIRSGPSSSLERMAGEMSVEASEALRIGPEEWLSRRLLAQIVRRLAHVNVRTVLPDGDSPMWDRLIRSFIARQPPVWEFFPSQIQAIESGLLTSDSSYSLQMPTGSGKTALTETLVYSHLTRRPTDVAVVLVPYRSLARELRRSMVRRLDRMGLSARAIYGGTVPARDEMRELEGLRLVVATPESLAGLLTTSPAFFSRISLVVVDEGHLLDSGARGVALELLLARMRRRPGPPPRFVFVSAIVPNIEEINSWLGGSGETVVRSRFRPSVADFAVLRSRGTGVRQQVDLELWSEASATVGRGPKRLQDFLGATEFRFVNPDTGRTNTFSFDSYKTKAVAAARKALELGGVALFAANKRGDQGVIGLAEELMTQLALPLSLPHPLSFVDDSTRLRHAADYLDREFGPGWIGARSLGAGVVVHHGDVPQETREVVEELLAAGVVRFVICTNTLAEGVNFPIRTLVLYSVRRREFSGSVTPMLARDIKNLAGRTGRAGSSTRGLVICANANQWPDLLPVVRGDAGETVSGALLRLIRGLSTWLRNNGVSLSNEFLEAQPALFSLVDGIDATLIELAVQQVTDTGLVEVARSLSAETLAAERADLGLRSLLADVFALRAERVASARAIGRASWVRETGSRLRVLDSVTSDLASSGVPWAEITVPTDHRLVDGFIDWALRVPDVQAVVSQTLEAEDGSEPSKKVRALTKAWLAGLPFREIAEAIASTADETLRLHAAVVANALVVAAEQGIGLLARLLQEDALELPEAVRVFPELLRYGVPTVPAVTLMASGMRHRSAAISLSALESVIAAWPDVDGMHTAARVALADGGRWGARLGPLVYGRTLRDVSPGTS